jgi:predicted transcriptional regulator
MEQNNSTPATYNFSVKIASDLKDPVRRLAFNTNQEIRRIISDATRDYLKKQKINIKEAEQYVHPNAE